ncbi:MAG: glycohydrolase toxin TNT-related protein [Naasia sp.]
MSGTLINPDAIPGVDLSAADISASAASYTSTAQSIGSNADQVLADWSGLSASYTAPEGPQLLSSMDPVGTEAHAFADKLATVGTLLDDLASAVEAPIRRLKELQIEAREFVESVRGGITVDYYDPDNTLNQANAMSGTPVYIPEGQGEQTLNWDEHTPSVERNNELIEQVATETAKLMQASADCVNGINALRDDVCIADATVYTADELIAAEELPWGTTGKGDRSCSESMGDGIVEFGTGFVGGIVALGGWDMENDWEHSGDTAAAAWTGLASGVGALVITATPGAAALMAAPPEWTPEWMHGAQDWYNGTMEAMVQGIVGTPEMWEEDPVAAGTFAFVSIASMFIPVAGQAGAGVRVASGLGRASLAVERVAGAVTDGSRLSNGLVRASDVLAGLSTSIRGLSEGLNGVRTVDSSLAGLDEAMRALDDIPDVVPDNLTSAVSDGGSGVPVRAGADAPPASVSAGVDTAPTRPDGTAPSGGDSTIVDTSGGSGTSGNGAGGAGGAGDGGSSTGTGGAAGGGAGSDANPGTPDGGTGTPDSAPAGAGNAPEGWTAGPEHRGDPVDPAYGQPRPDHGTLDDRFAPPSVLPDEIQHLVRDPEAPYGRAEDGTPYSREQWQERYIGPDNRPIYPGNDGAVVGSRAEFTDASAFRAEYGGLFDRMGGDGGGYLAFPDTPFEQRALPGSNLNAPYSTFRLADELPDGVRIEVSEIAPAFGQPGGGMQVRFLDGDVPLSVEDMTSPRYGILERVEMDSPTVPTDADSPAVGHPAEGGTGVKTEVLDPFDPDRKGALLADVSYRASAPGTDHSYRYETNANGLIDRVTVDELNLKDADRSRFPNARDTPDKLPGDDAGHLIADMFDGDHTLRNLVSQAWTLNRGAGSEWAAMERAWRDALSDVPPRAVTDVAIDVLYDASRRPIGFDVSYKVDGVPGGDYFPNPVPKVE